LVVRPTVFGPIPQDVYDFMHTSLKYRKMAHTVEDVTIQLLVNEFGVNHDLFFSSDIKNGFLLRFVRPVELDFDKLAERVGQRLAENLPVRYQDETHITIGDSVMYCTGPRLHLSNTEEVGDFTLIRKFIRDEKTDTYCLVGMLRQQEEEHSNPYNFHCSSAVLA
jgi:hypothetical protein